MFTKVLDVLNVDHAIEVQVRQVHGAWVKLSSQDDIDAQLRVHHIHTAVLVEVTWRT